MSPRFLSLARVVEIQRNSIETYGGDPGVRDNGLLESAIAQPQAMFGGQFLHEDIESMGAAYLFHLVMNHPFVDGNKRVGAMAAFIFLEMNGRELMTAPEAYRDLVLDLAAGKLDKADVIAFFKKHVRAKRRRRRKRK
jgi:death-on-curing protein